jgi:hypothetical protein
METVDHKLKITGRGEGSWGECSCGDWFSGPGLTLSPPRKAIKGLHDRHLEIVQRDKS